MATQNEIVEEVIRPMELAMYKVPQGAGDRADFVGVYFRVLKGYTPKQLRAATTKLLATSTYTPKPEAFIKVLKDAGTKGSGLFLTEDDEGYWPWVEHRCKQYPSARQMYEKGGRFHNRLAVPSELPPGHEEGAA